MIGGRSPDVEKMKARDDKGSFMELAGMTPEEFKEAMQVLVEHKYDAEITHADMDSLICNLLRELGYGEGVDIFEKAEKWYA